MLAIVVCGGLNPALHGLDEHRPAELLQLGDRSILQHTVEYLIRLGATDLHLILSDRPEQIEAYFGDGTRWGRSVRYHLAANQERIPRLIRAICNGLQGEVVMATGWRLPGEIWPDPEPAANFAITRQTDGQTVWSGWAQASVASVRDWFVDGSMGTLSERILHSDLARFEMQNWLTADSAASLLASQRLLLEGATPISELVGSQVEKGAWIGRNSSIHPTAVLQPPFWIGPDCRIGARARIGPYAVVSERCIIDDDSIVEESMVTAGTYIGQGLELNQAIVDRNRLVNARLDTTYLISDAFLAGTLEAKTQSSRIRLSEQVIAIVLLLLLSPLWLISMVAGLLDSKRRLATQEFVLTPADEDQRSWLTWERRLFQPASSHFWHEFLPGLPVAAMGRLGLTGVQPRDPASLMALPQDWRSACISCRPGLITEAVTAYSAGAEPEEIYSAESYYAAVQSFQYNLRLLGRYAVKVMSPFSRVRAQPVEQ